MAKHRAKWSVGSGTRWVPGVGMVTGWWAEHPTDPGRDRFFTRWGAAMAYAGAYAGTRHAEAVR
ncbi:hypothetical protein [Gordonia sp. NPDC003376]